MLPKAQSCLRESFDDGEEEQETKAVETGIVALAVWVLCNAYVSIGANAAAVPPRVVPTIQFRTHFTFYFRWSMLPVSQGNYISTAVLSSFASTRSAVTIGPCRCLRKMPASSVRTAASRCAFRLATAPAAPSCSVPSAARRAAVSCRGASCEGRLPK